MSKNIHSNTRREPAYYTAVLHVLIACANKSMTYPAMAEVLNSQNLTTPTNLQWTGDAVKGLMKKLKNYRIYPSFIHTHLLQLIFEGTLTMKETLPLFQSRRRCAK